MSVTAESTRWMITGFQTQVFLLAWTLLVLLYGLFRSFGEGEPDAIRPSGPGV